MGVFSGGDAVPVVLHSVQTFLRASENWIYPQVTRTRRYEGHVLFERREGATAFPLDASRLHIVSNHRGRWWARMLSRVMPLARYLAKRRLRKAVGWLRPAVLHSHFGPQGWRDLALAQRLGCPHVVSFYGEDLCRLARREPWATRYAELFDEADACLVEGPRMAETLADIGCPREKIRVRPHGVDIEQIQYRARPLNPGGIVRVLVAGRFVEKKGIPYAVRAVTQVMRELPQVSLTLVGDAAKGDDAGEVIVREVRMLLESGDLQSRVRWHRFLPLAEFLNLAATHDLFVQASITAEDGDAEGGFPVVLLQLAATGMPFVATRHCDIPEIVVDGVTGYLVDERNVGGLAAAIRQLVTKAELRGVFGKAARELVETKFSMEATIERLEEVYDELVSGSRGSYACTMGRRGLNSAVRGSR